MRKLRLQTLLEAAMMAALAYILDLLPAIQFGPSISISFAMVPVMIVALRWGTKAGILSGFLWGAIQVITWDVWFVHPIQLIMEYVVAFAFVGFTGLFASKFKIYNESNNRLKAILILVFAIFFGCLARYFWHFLAGFIFWAETGASAAAAVWYSFWVNGITALGAAILCTIVIVFLLRTYPRILTQSIQQNFSS